MDGLTLSILTAATLGHAALVIAIANRLIAMKLPCRFLVDSETLLHGCILVVPIGLFIYLRDFQFNFWQNAPWFNLPTWLVGYGGICVAMSLGTLLSRFGRAIRGTTRLQVGDEAKTVDVARQIGRRPVGIGRFSVLARLPGNQCFKLQVARKAFRVPGLPPELDGISILHLSDFHFNGAVDRAYFEHAVQLGMKTEPDLIAFTGDLLDDLACVDWIPSTLGQMRAPLGCYFLLGNHDWYLDAPRVRAAMVASQWQDVAGQTMMVYHQQHCLAISGTELPWMGHHPDLSGVPRDAIRILLSHTPDNIGWARKQRVDLMLAGHTHGGQIRLPGLGAVYTPSRHGSRFASGGYWLSPTLLYVNRGLSGRQPIRFRCLPEIALLELRSAVPRSEAGFPWQNRPQTGSQRSATHVGTFNTETLPEGSMFSKSGKHRLPVPRSTKESVTS